MSKLYDVAIIGGGINGCGCAADAALRGLSVFLCEKDDIASKTSSQSTKLIHGGLRYLEHYQFGMVKKALCERQILLQQAPHLVHPLAMVLPYNERMRPAWILRAGLWIYDHLSFNNRLPKAKLIHRAPDSEWFNPLSHLFKKGFLFYDAVTDDARLTIANALQAKEHGADIYTRTRLIKACHANKIWTLTLQSSSNDVHTIQAKSVVNAAGPWLESVAHLLHHTPEYPRALIKGSHIVLPKLYDGPHAYILQHGDKRIVFVIPFHEHTMVGTTDVFFSKDLDNISIDSEEIDYLLSLVNHYFLTSLKPHHIIHHWSGVRPLMAEEGKSAASLSRDYVLTYSNASAPIVTIYSGKITTYRQLAQQAINALEDVFIKLAQSTTKITCLPGAMFKNMDYAQYQAFANSQYAWLEQDTLQRLLTTYGTRCEHFLQDCNTTSDLGYYFGNTLYQAEVDYLMNEEWAITAEDILWRRTKLGLTSNKALALALESYMSEHRVKKPYGSFSSSARI